MIEFHKIYDKMVTVPGFYMFFGRKEEENGNEILPAPQNGAIYTGKRKCVHGGIV